MASNPPLVPRGGKVGVEGGAVRAKRNRRSELTIWWREIDRTLLALVLTLMAMGAAAVAASSPASARRLSTASVRLDDLHFFYLHIRYQILGLIAMFGASMLPRDMARRAGIVLCCAMLVGLMLVPLIGFSVNGARRWLNLGMSLQPSEFLKPAFAIGMAWILSWRARDPNLPVIAITTALMGLIAGLLMMQPDFGSAILFIGVWFVMVLMSGISLQRIGLAGGAGLAFVVLAYMFYENARNRIDSFLGGGTAFDQVDLAQRTLLAGGWTGSGLWLGT
ncbi:MAG TPA: FtsW/RodA/SpoVE family cell cycle protein, partial [Novosphingobium sp.]|nr:FtsW/RodA/SpoVE family cell cycle protein [Novosphingobium sp.]